MVAKLALFVFFVSSVVGGCEAEITCYECTYADMSGLSSTGSASCQADGAWDAAAPGVVVRTCGSNVTACSMTTWRLSVLGFDYTTVTRTCGPSVICDANTLDSMTTVECCTGDLCNGARSFTVVMATTGFALLTHILIV